MAKRGDDFKASTRRTLGQRAGYFCSNPECGQLAVEPHSDNDKTVIFGEAAHIYAAEAGGARYDKAPKDFDRSSIENAIWLCNICHKKIDSDENRYRPELIFDWKSYHEEFMRSQEQKIRLIKSASPRANNISPSERDVAQMLINTLGVRRVFFNEFDNETPIAVKHSIIQIRDILTESQNALFLIGSSSELNTYIVAMQKLCMKFLDEVEKMHLSLIVIGENDAEVNTFFAALGRFRGSISGYISIISTDYKIKLGEGLKSLVKNTSNIVQPDSST